MGTLSKNTPGRVWCVLAYPGVNIRFLWCVLAHTPDRSNGFRCVRQDGLAYTSGRYGGFLVHVRAVWWVVVVTQDRSSGFGRAHQESTVCFGVYIRPVWWVHCARRASLVCSGGNIRHGCHAHNSVYFAFLRMDISTHFQDKF